MPRLALMSTPRSGNMWLRRMLVSLLDATELSADTPAAVPWRDLADDAVLQLHWPPTDDLLARLDAHGFATLALARHPLDVLVSILQFAQAESRTARWLGGADGDERALVGADPTSDAFRAYALSDRARSLLGVTPAWWASERRTARIRYEDLVDAPAAWLRRLAEELALEPVRDLDDVVAANTLDALRAETGSAHFWRGRPGSWRALLPAPTALEIAAAHGRALTVCGYETEPDPSLSVEEARERWRALIGDGNVPRALPAPAAGGRLGARLEQRRLPAADLVERVYRLALGREPDADGLRRALERLAGDLVSPATLLHELVSSLEGRAVRGLRAPPDAPEAAIALPWALARARAGVRVLDVGSAYAEPAYLAALLDLDARTLAAADPAPVPLEGIELTRADVRALPFPARSFDVALCLGTLHHVGADNRAYGLPVEHDPSAPRAALRELRRVLARDGQLLVSVPCGREQDLGLFVVWPSTAWLRLFADAGFFVFEHELYELGPDGWESAATPPDGVGYADRGAGAGALLCAELRPGRLRNEARRRASAAVRSVGRGGQ